MGLTHRSLTSPCHSFADAVHLEGIPGLCWGWSPAYALAVQSLTPVWLFVTLWTAVHQGPLSSIISRSLLKLTSIELKMTSNHFILCWPLLPSIFPSIRVFSKESAPSDGQNIGASPSASVLPMNIQGWFPLGWTGLISLQSKGLSRVFSSTTLKKHQFFRA